MADPDPDPDQGGAGRSKGPRAAASGMTSKRGEGVFSDDPAPVLGHPMAADPLWDDWDTPLNAPAIPVLHLDGFDGPMDLLLDLAERQRIDLGKMSVLALAEQFVAAMERLVDRVALEQRADWLVMATRLVLLRSRLLFPASPEAAAEAARDAAAELHRLDVLTRMRDAASWLQARPQLGQDVFARPMLAQPREGGYVALLEACLVVLRGRAGEPAEMPLYRPAIPVLWRVPQALARIRALLADHPEGDALAFFLPPLAADAPDRPLQARAAVASTFLAGLELARDGQIRLEQAAEFGAVTLHPLQAREASDETAR
jgi:segregation and condensation protein A